MFGCLFRLFRLALVLVLLAALAGAAFYYLKLHPEKAPWVKDGATAVKEKVSTMSLAAQVKAALALRESLKDLDLSVSAEKDVVTLRGKAPDSDASKTAESVAASVPGVRQVVNFIEIDPLAAKKAVDGDSRTIGEKVDDEALELKVRAAFKLDKALKDAGFEVKAMRKALTISSQTASADQKNRALEIARSVEGVSKVEVR
jgi:hyperosmotically inducible protein